MKHILILHSNSVRDQNNCMRTKYWFMNSKCEKNDFRIAASSSLNGNMRYMRLGNHIISPHVASPGNWKTTGRIMMNSGYRRRGKETDPRLQNQKRPDKSINAKCGRFLPIILHSNVEGLSTNRICDISQLATRHKALVFLLQETHCTNADQLLILHFTLAGWVSSRKHVLATFVHEKLSCALMNQSLERSSIERFCVDIDGCKIINVDKLPTSQLTPTGIPVFSYPCLYAGFNFQT